MIVEPTTSTVYKAGGRRWLTKNAAYNAAARAKIKERCECCPGDAVTPGETCLYHEDAERYETMKRRLAQIYKNHDKGDNNV